MSNARKLQRPIIVFDGACVLCNRWVQFIVQNDVRKQFKFASMQSERGRRLLHEQGLNPDDPSSLLLIDESGAHMDSDAIIRVISRFGGMWKLVAVLRILPSFLRDATNRCIARNRYPWFGKHETCMVPTQDIADRFIQ